MIKRNSLNQYLAKQLYSRGLYQRNARISKIPMFSRQLSSHRVYCLINHPPNPQKYHTAALGQSCINYSSPTSSLATLKTPLLLPLRHL